MTVASPWVLGVALAAAVGVLLSHLLSVRRPPLFMLPTTRFLPTGSVRAVSMSTRPSDLLLLMLRLLAVLFAGLAFAGVQWAATREPIVNLVVIDAAAEADDSLVWRASVERVLQESPAAAVVLSNGQVLNGDSLTQAGDSIVVMPSRTGSLASALLAARRAAQRIPLRGDSIALQLVSPLRADANTDALDTARAMWPGRIAVIPVSFTQAADSARDRRLVVRATGDNDAVRAAFARWQMLVTADARVVRDRVTPDDMSFARNGGVLVLWPDALSAAASPVDSATAGPLADSLADSLAGAVPLPAVVANGRALVARGLTPIAQTDAFAINEAAPAATVSNVRTVAWWPDGSSAATERKVGKGCVREVLFSAPNGDALLNVSARGVLAALAAPCGVAAGLGTRPALTEAQISMLRGDGPLASADAFRGAGVANPWARWLVLAAAVCLLAEMLVRRKSPVLTQ